MSKGASSEAAPRKTDPSKPGVSMPMQPEDLVSKTLVLEAEVRAMRGEFRQFRHETSVELSRLDEFEDRMDFLDLEVDDEDENAKASELTLSELMTGVEYDRPISQGKVRKPRSDLELIGLLRSQVASLTSALELVTERCEALEQAVKASPLEPTPSSQTGSLAALLSRVAALEASSAAPTNAAAAAVAASAAAAAAAAANGALRARIAALEAASTVATASSAALPAVGPHPSVSAASATPTGASGTSTKTAQAQKKKSMNKPSVAAPGPASASPEADDEAPWVKAIKPPAAPEAQAPGVPEADGPWKKVETKKKKKGPTVLTVEMIETSKDRLGLLLAQDFKGRETREILVTHAVVPLSVKAQTRPYLAWRSLLVALTGQKPLNIVLIHPRRAIIYWDVSDVEKKTRILGALETQGFFRFPAEEGVVADHHYLRAYKSGYFKLLRQAVLVGRTPYTITWILDKAEEFWKASQDKVRRHIWLRRIAWDRQALANGVVVAAGDRPSLNPDSNTTGTGTDDDRTPCVTCQKWICDYIYLTRERQEAVKTETAGSAPPDGAAMEGAG